MKAVKIYTEKTGKLINTDHYLNSSTIKSVDGEYLKWLEQMVESKYRIENFILKGE